MHTSISRTLAIISSSIVLVPIFALASATPQVTAFQATPTTISNNYITSLTWTIDSNNGADILIPCSPGITAQTDAHQSITCGVRFPAGTTSTGSQGLMLTNVSGASKGVLVTLYPRDSNGNDYDAGSMGTFVTVGTSPQPILTTSVSAPTIVSGSPLTVSWTGVDAANANIQFSCSDSIKIYQSAPTTAGQTPLPCGTIAFSSDLPISGSVTVYPVSTATNPPTITVNVLPVIGSGMFDLIHSLTASFSVTPQPAAPALSITKFSATPSTIGANVPFSVRWDIANATSSNIEIDCPDTLTVSTVIGTTTTPITCGAMAFVDPLGATGTTTFTVSAKSPLYSSQTLTALIIPRGPTGDFLRNMAQSAQITFDPRYQTPVAANVVAPVTSVTTTPPTATTPRPNHYTFTLPLKRGSRNADVTALQKYLATDVALYPEGSVTGYFGPATAAAVGRFQLKYKLTVVGDSAYGTVGPKTRAQLNSAQ